MDKGAIFCNLGRACGAFVMPVLLIALIGGLATRIGSDEGAKTAPVSIITGTAEVAQTLISNPGTWHPFALRSGVTHALMPPAPALTEMAGVGLFVMRSSRLWGLSLKEDKDALWVSLTQ